MKITEEKILKDLRVEFEKETGIKLDFRSHVHLDNNYGLSPTFDYDFAEKIVGFTFGFLNKYGRDNIEAFPKFGDGLRYNLMMSCDELRTGCLHSFIRGEIFNLMLTMDN